MARLFFAIWPDEDAAAALAALAERVAGFAGGRAVPLGKIHLTLAFLGEVPEDALGRALEAAPPKARRFELVLDHAGSFRKSKVAWAGSSEPPPELLDLQAALAKRLADRGFALDDRPFAPHVTVARHIERALARRPIAPRIAWRARELTLVRSELGTGRYAVVERWNLGG